MITAVGVAPEVAEIVRSWMSFGLRGFPEAGPENPKPEDLDAALDFVLARGGLGMAAQAAMDQPTGLPDEYLSRIGEVHGGSMGHVLRLERSLVQAVAALSAEGIDHRVQKGLAVAHTVYSWPAIRTSSDVDLLVPDNDFPRAIEVLVADGGAVVEKDELRVDYNRSFAKAVDLRDQWGVGIDLHRRVSVGHFGHAIDMGEFFDRAIPFELAGQQLLAPSMEAMFMNACLRATVAYGYQLSTLRDIAEIAVHDHFDEALMRRIAASWKAEAVVSEALQRTEIWIPGAAALVGGLGSWRVSARDKKRLAAFGGGGKPLSLMAQKAWAQPTWSAKVAFLRNYVLPDKAYLDRNGGPLGYGRFAFAKVSEFVRRTVEESRFVR